MTYKVGLRREWIEYGELIVEAEDESEAEEMADEAASMDDTRIEWASENMEPGKIEVENVELINKGD